MKDYQLTKYNLYQFFSDIQDELDKTSSLVVTTHDANTGKWGMARLWRSWMSKTAEFMAANGCTMPLMVKTDGYSYGKRLFNAEDAHELFCSQWLGVDSDGIRLSWAKKNHDGMRAATKGERFNALRKHEVWASERGIVLFKPRNSEYAMLEKESEN